MRGVLGHEGSDLLVRLEIFAGMVGGFVQSLELSIGLDEAGKANRISFDQDTAN